MTYWWSARTPGRGALDPHRIHGAVPEASARRAAVST